MCPFYNTPIFVPFPSRNSCKSSIFGPSTVIFDLYLIPTKKKKARNRYPRGIQVDPGHKLCVRGKRSENGTGAAPEGLPKPKMVRIFRPGPTCRSCCQHSNSGLVYLHSSRWMPFSLPNLWPRNVEHQTSCPRALLFIVMSLFYSRSGCGRCCFFFSGMGGGSSLDSIALHGIHSAT